MKKLFTLFTLIALAFNAQAQINTFPASEDFEAAFDTGTNVVFIPNWTGSIVKPTIPALSRIFADTAHARNGAQALAAIPTSTTPDTITVALDLSAVANMMFSFWACTAKNGTPGDTRASLIKISTSIDGGVTYGPETLIGDSVVFANANTSYNPYSYAFPANTNNQSNVRMRMVITRSAGVGQAGSAARVVIDDATFINSTVDIFPPTAVAASMTSISTVDVQFSEPMGISAETVANYTGVPNLVSAVRNGSNDVVTLTFSPALTEGQFYSLTVDNAQDLAGNALAAPATFSFVFNDNTGNVKITEIFYNDPGFGVDSLEFIEIKNMEASAINIGGWKFTAGINYTFPSATTINAGSYIVLARFASTFTTFFGGACTQWDSPAALTNTGETIALSNASNTLIDSVAYSNVAPWDTLANGYGYSLVLCDENLDNDQPSNWSRSFDPAGSAQWNGVSIFASPNAGCTVIGLNDHQVNAFDLTAYPNPTADQLNVVFTAEKRAAYTVQILDLSGRVVMTEQGMSNAGENRSYLSTRQLAGGMYILSVENEAGKSQFRFVKN